MKLLWKFTALILYVICFINFFIDIPVINKNIIIILAVVCDIKGDLIKEE
jgi:hypothetical protein